MSAIKNLLYDYMEARDDFDSKSKVQGNMEIGCLLSKKP